MRKDKQFSIRISAQDLETIRQKAVQAHMSQSDYVISCCLGKKIIILDGLKEVLRQQKAIGNNLNQLTGGAGEYGQGTVRQFGFCCVNSRQERPINIYDCNTSSTRYK